MKIEFGGGENPRKKITRKLIFERLEKMILYVTLGI
jgi:hypothetical protein